MVRTSGGLTFLVIRVLHIKSLIIDFNTLLIKPSFPTQAIPRSVRLDKSGNQLVQWPVKELETFRTTRVDLAAKLLRKGSSFEVSGITASQVSSAALINFEMSNSRKLSIKMHLK